jgi:hypothetical protein
VELVDEVLSAAVLSRRRHLAGLWLLATVSLTLTVLRLVGLAIDGPAPFTLFVLKPKVAITLASAAALFVEHRRTRASPA